MTPLSTAPTLFSSLFLGCEELGVIALYRMQLTGVIHPDNGSTIEAVSAIGIVRTGYLVE